MFVKGKVMRTISIVIPTYNEKDYLQKLLESIAQVNYPLDHYEVIVVSDGSTDGTPGLVRDKFPWVRLIDLKENVGRYEARKLGVEAAKYDYILFVDTRTLLDPDSLTAIDRSDHEAIKGLTVCGNPSNPYHIVFESIRYKLYPRFYRRRSETFEITADNFDSAPKGTGVFMANKEILLSTYEDLSALKMGTISSDDTLLIRTLVNYTPVAHHPGVKIIRFIRESFVENFLHLIYRGSTFVYYYLDPSKRLFWLVIVFPILVLLALVAALVFLPIPWYLVPIGLVLLDAMAAVYLGTSWRETWVIFLMIPVCVSAFYIGVVRGIFRRLFKVE